MFTIPWTSYFLNPGLHVWFWILVPLIIIYLIKPKPINQTIPSLMFILQDKGTALKNSFLKYLYRDFVFFIQLLILTLLVAAACQPYITIQKTMLAGNSVIILDASASMQTSDGRWNDALASANNNLARQNTIILVENRPVIIARDANKQDAAAALQNLEPLDTETNLYAAIMASREFATDADSIVTIISDFKNSDEQQDITAAIKTIQASGATVNLISVGTTEVKNVGIISLDVQDDKTRIGVKNYNSESIVTTLRAPGFEQAMPLGSGSIDYATITTPTGTTTITLDSKDDFSLDDSVTIANNPTDTLKILVITNNLDIKNTAFWYALQSINDKTPLHLLIETSAPPALPNINRHDIIIFADVNKDLIVQRTIREARDHVESGKAVIIITQPNLFSINFEGLLPFTYQAAGGASAISPGEFTGITKSIEFGDTQAYTIITANARVIAQATDKTPLITLMAYGKGRVLYYGIPDTESTFPFEPNYPIFWKRSLDELSGRASAASLNYKTGVSPLITGSPSETPEDFFYQGFLDKQGIYVFPDRALAANLVSEAESDVAASQPPTETSATAMSAEESLKRKDLTSIAIFAVLALLFLELFIVKYRGDF